MTSGTLAGCLGSVTGSGADSIAVAATEGEGRLFRRLTDQYVAEDTGIEIDVKLFSYSGLFEQNRRTLGNGRDEFDLIFMDDPWFPGFADDVEPIRKWLPDEVPGEYVETTLDIAHWPTPRGPLPPEVADDSPELRGLVVVGNTQIFTYNAAYFEQVGQGRPSTYEDVISAARGISDGIEDAHGFTIRGADGNPIVANFFAIGFSMAGDMFDESWQFQWDSQAGVEAVSFFTEDLAAVSPQGITEYNEDEVVAALASGDAAQAHTWPDTASLILEEGGPAADDLDFAVMPGNGNGRRAPQQGNWIVGINSHTSEAKKQACGEVVQSFVSREAQEQYVEVGGIPFRHDTFQNNIDAEPWFEALYESLKQAQWRPRTPLWTDIEAVLGTRLHETLGGQITPEVAMQSAGEEITGMLEDAGYY